MYTINENDAQLKTQKKKNHPTYQGMHKESTTKPNKKEDLLLLYENSDTKNESRIKISMAFCRTYFSPEIKKAHLAMYPSLRPPRRYKHAHSKCAMQYCNGTTE